MRILYPINIDHWTDPIATLLRAIALHNPQLAFFSFSQPRTPEDRTAGQVFWAQPHIHRITTPDVVKHTFDIVHHASATEKNLLAALLCRARSLGRGTHIFTANTQPDRQSRYYPHYCLSLRLAQRIVAVSQVVADDIQQQFGRTVDAVIPNGVDLTFFDPATAQPEAIHTLGIQPPYVLFVGVLKQRKRPDIFIQLAALLPQIQFVMVGGAFTEAEREHFLTLAAHCPNVIYLGLQPRERVRDLMAAALALIFPSELEGLPLTVVEAAAMGLPVLAQPKSSLPELVHAGVTGWLLPLEPLTRWAYQVQQLTAWSPAERQAFAHQARASVARRYAWATIAHQYRDLYQRCT